MALIKGSKLPGFNKPENIKKYVDTLKEMKLPDDALKVIGYGNEGAFHNVRYRCEIYNYGCKRAMKLSGDLVDFGTYHGIFPFQFHRNNKEVGMTGKTHFLFDSWGQDWEKHDDPELKKLKGSDQYRYSNDIFDEVKQRFECFKHVQLVRGLLPGTAEVLQKVHSISFACIDVNAGSGLEGELILKVWDKMSIGAMLYVDDYGFSAYPKIRAWTKNFSELNNCPIFEIPTGSCFLLKS